MNVQVVQLAPIRVVMYRHRGSYGQIGPKFDQLWEWVSGHGVPAQRTIGIYWDNPDFVPEKDLRSAACIEVPSYFNISDKGGLAINIEDISGGTYATTTVTGPYESLAQAWTQMTEYIEGPLGRKISDRAAFEVYINDASETPASQLITELYMPLV